MALADRSDRVGQDLVRAVRIREALAEVDAARGDGQSGHLCEDRGPKALHSRDEPVVPYHWDDRRRRLQLRRWAAVQSERNYL